MSESSSREQYARSTKAEYVLDAARTLFTEHGFGATSMDAIAAAAGVSKATVYAHYDGKQALFAATTARGCERVMADMAIPSDVEDLPPAVALERIARSFVAAIFAPENLALLRVVMAEVRRFPELGGIFYDCAPGLTRSEVARYLERARAHGLIDTADCDLAAAQFLAALRGDLHLRALLGQPVTADEIEANTRFTLQTFVAHHARWRE